MLGKKQLTALISLGLLIGYGVLQADDNRGATDTLNKNIPSSVKETEKTQPPIDMKKLSEAFGNFIGRNLQSPGLSFDLEGIIKGIREGAAGQPSPLTEKEYEDMMAAVQEKAFKEMSSANLKNANEFMTKNRQVTGVVEVVPSKLQFLVLKEGTGAVVEPHSSPKIHYTGKYQDGTVFGTSEEMGGPITIPLDQTIPGFSKGISGMREGEKRRLFVHPDLGYGTSGQLPPNELLIFDIDVVKANSEEAKSKGQPTSLRNAAQESSKGSLSDDDEYSDGEAEEIYFDDEDFEGSDGASSSQSMRESSQSQQMQSQTRR